MALNIVQEEVDWRRYKQTKTYKEYIENEQTKIERIQQIELVQQIERVQRVDGLINVTNQDYKKFTNLSGTIMYLDPPYENASNTYKTGSFDSDAFYNWAYDMSKNNIVIISSYELSDERFEPVFEFKTARSTLSANGRGDRTEKLFMVKVGL